MESDFLRIASQIAGIGGIALIVFLILFREIIRKNIFPKLSKIHAYFLMVIIAILIWSIAVIGIAAWYFSQERKTAEENQKTNALGESINIKNNTSVNSFSTETPPNPVNNENETRRTKIENDKGNIYYSEESMTVNK